MKVQAHSSLEPPMKQSGPDTFDESEFCYGHLTILEVTEIF